MQQMCHVDEQKHIHLQEVEAEGEVSLRLHIVIAPAACMFYLFSFPLLTIITILLHALPPPHTFQW